MDTSSNPDINCVNFNYALQIAREYYDSQTFKHVCRVAEYVKENDMIPDRMKEDCMTLAVMHDLLEDTDYVMDHTLPSELRDALGLITKPKHMDYVEYIKRIRNCNSISWCEHVFWVKLMDMKDHLAQKETLTDRLKEKYLHALPYLL